MPASISPPRMVYTSGMPDGETQRLEQLLEELRREIADIQLRHEKALREILEKVRARRLAELRSDITAPK